MALIHCPECSKEVSDKAPACPHCGAPIAAAAEQKAAGVPLTTVQETSKRLKSHILISAALFWGGLVLMLTSVNSEQSGGVPPSPMAFMLMTITGLTWYVVTKVRIWWHHK